MTTRRTTTSRALVALLFLAAAPAAAQIPAERDTVRLSLGQAIAIAYEQNPQVARAAAFRSASGAGLWNAYGNLLPRVSLSGDLQKTNSGTFVFLGQSFTSPEQYSTIYQWDFTHSLFDAGRDLLRIKSARAEVDREIASYDDRAWQVASDVKVQYLNAGRASALADQARREVERLATHLRLAEARYRVGAVTKSDVLQAQLTQNQGDVAVLQADQTAREARLSLRSLLGGALPAGTIVLTSDFQVFEPAFGVDSLVAVALGRHPAIRRLEAQERVDEANLWIARSRYIPSVNAQYSLSRSVTDSTGFKFEDFDQRNFLALSLNWQLFGSFSRYNETSRANAQLRATREDERGQELQIEEAVRTAHARLVTAYAAHRSATLSVELAREDLRLGEGRYETGAGSFVDLLDAQVRATKAETDVITATYDFYLALVALERAAGVPLMPSEDMR